MYARVYIYISLGRWEPAHPALDYVNECNTRLARSDAAQSYQHCNRINRIQLELAIAVLTFTMIHSIQ